MLTIRKLRDFLASLPADADEAFFVLPAPDRFQPRITST